MSLNDDDRSWILPTKELKEVEFSEFEKQKTYTVKILDIFDYDRRQYTKSTAYLIFKCVVRNTYPELHLKIGDLVKIHFSETCFKKAWARSNDLDFKSGDSVLISFRRQSRSRFQILQLERGD